MTEDDPACCAAGRTEGGPEREADRPSRDESVADAGADAAASERNS